MSCTWKGCACKGVHAQLDKQGHQWASLCPEHDAKLTQAIKATPFNPGRLMSAWINAQGGAKVAAGRTLGRV